MPIFLPAPELIHEEPGQDQHVIRIALSGLSLTDDRDAAAIAVVTELGQIALDSCLDLRRTQSTIAEHDQPLRGGPVGENLVSISCQSRHNVANLVAIAVNPRSKVLVSSKAVQPHGTLPFTQ